MNRYIHRNWIRNVKKTGATSVEDYANTDHDQRPARFVQMYAGYIGLILVLVGLTIILGDIIGTSAGGRKFMSLFPVILGGGAYVFYKMSHPESKILRELTSAFLLITFAISLFTSVDAFGMSGDVETRYLFYIVLAVGLALIYLNNSSLTAYLYISTLIYWGYMFFVAPLFGLLMSLMPFGRMGMGGASSVGFFGDVSGIELSIAFLVFLGGLYKFLDENVKQNEYNFKTVLLGWLVSFAVLFGSSIISGGNMLLGLSGAVFALYVFGKRYHRYGYAFWNRPLQTTAIIGAILIYMLSSHDFILGFTVPSMKDVGGDQIVGLLISLGIIGGTGYYYFKNHWEKDDRLNLPMIGIPALALIAFLVRFGGTDAMAFPAILFTLGGIALAGYWLKSGLDSKYPPLLLLGIITLLYVMLSKVTIFFDMEPILIGLIVLIVGAAYLFVVKLIDDGFNIGSLKDIIPEGSAIDKLGKKVPGAGKSSGSSSDSGSTGGHTGGSNDGGSHDDGGSTGGSDDTGRTE